MAARCYHWLAMFFSAFHVEQRLRRVTANISPRTEGHYDLEQMEHAMNKPLIALAAATVALSSTALTSSAEAGFGIRVGFGALHMARMHYESRHCHRHVSTARHQSEHVYVAKRRVHTPVVASEDATPAPVVTGENENSSITTAALDPAATPDTGADTATNATPVTTDTTPAPDANATPATPDTSAAVMPPVVTGTSAEVTPAVTQKVADSKAADCKAFFPTVGITLSVPCQK